MANELEHLGEAGLTIYAKPLPLVAAPWADDAVSLTDPDGIGYYSADVAAPAESYAVYEQAGASPASTDGPAVATINRTVEANMLRKGTSYRYSQTDGSDPHDVLIDDIP